MQIGDDLDDLEEVVEGDDGVEEHEERFGNAQDVFQGSRRPRLEVAHAVVAYVADGAAGERWELRTGHHGLAVLAQLLGQDGQRVRLGAMAGAGLDDFAGIWTTRQGSIAGWGGDKTGADEAITGYSFNDLRALEEE